MSEEEIAQNQKMWAEESGEAKDDAIKGNDLRNVGVTGGGISSDLAGQTGDVEPEEPLNVTGEEGTEEA